MKVWLTEAALAQVLLVGCAHSGPPSASRPDALQPAPVQVVEAPDNPLPSGCMPPPRKAAPASFALPNGGVVKVAGYGHDATDNSSVGWDQEYPSPCFDDVPNRKGLPNAAWQGNYWLDGQNLCFSIVGLHSQHPPTHQLQIGYTVELTGATFEDGETMKNLVLHEFRDRPKQQDFKSCVRLRL